MSPLDKLIAAQTRSTRIRSNPFPPWTSRVQNGITVFPGVADPAPDNVDLLRVLLANRRLYEGKFAADIGCGCGVIGLLMLINGAKHVTFSDVSNAALSNTRFNLRQYNFEKAARIIRSDLLQAHERNYDFIAFNHPFFVHSNASIKGLRNAFVARRPIFRRFLREAKEHLTSTGAVLAHYFARENGKIDENDPQTAASMENMTCTVLYRRALSYFGDIGIYQICVITAGG